MIIISLKNYTSEASDYILKRPIREKSSFSLVYNYQLKNCLTRRTQCDRTLDLEGERPFIIRLEIYGTTFIISLLYSYINCTVTE